MNTYDFEGWLEVKMSEFYNSEYLSERLAAVCKERDELRQIVEKQAAMNVRVTELVLELDQVKAERDALLQQRS